MSTTDSPLITPSNSVYGSMMIVGIALVCALMLYWFGTDGLGLVGMTQKVAINVVTGGLGLALILAGYGGLRSTNRLLRLLGVLCAVLALVGVMLVIKA